MKTILIAHRDVAFAAQLASQLRNGGYSVISSPGPWPAVERSIRCDKGYCPPTEGADLLIYDPRLTAFTALGQLAPHVHAAAHEPAAPLRQIHDLLAPSPQSIALLAHTASARSSA